MVEHVQLARDERCRTHPHRDRLAVQQRPIAGGCFERVADRVAVIQEHPIAQLALIALHDLGFELDRARDDRRQRFARLRCQLLDLSLQVGEQLPIEDHRHLDHLGHAGRERARRQRRQYARIRDDTERLVEGADQVLAALVVDAGLAAHRGVDLR